MSVKVVIGSELDCVRAMFSRAMLTTVKRFSDRKLAQSDDVPCLSASISRTF